MLINALIPLCKISRNEKGWDIMWFTVMFLHNELPSLPKMVCWRENRTRSVSTTPQQLYKDASVPLECQTVPSLRILQMKKGQTTEIIFLGGEGGSYPQDVLREEVECFSLRFCNCRTIYGLLRSRLHEEAAGRKCCNGGRCCCTGQNLQIGTGLRYLQDLIQCRTHEIQMKKNLKWARLENTRLPTIWYIVIMWNDIL